MCSLHDISHVPLAGAHRKAVAGAPEEGGQKQATSNASCSCYMPLLLCASTAICLYSILCPYCNIMPLLLYLLYYASTAILCLYCYICYIMPLLLDASTARCLYF